MANGKAFILAVAAATILTSGAAFAGAVSANGPEPYSGPDPQYAPMKSEPLLQKSQAEPASLTAGQQIDGPAAGPEPYSAPDPQYKPMTHEPLLQKTETAPVSLTTN